MDADTSTFRSDRRWQRRPPPPAGRPKLPDASNADQEAPGSPGPRGSAALFSCHVCLETARDPVVTRCGHLFCWPCLYRLVRRHRPRGACPVCKSTVTVDPGDVAGVTPIYGVEGGLDGVLGGGGVGGGGGDGELSSEVPPRPRGLQGTSEGEDLEVFREELRVLSRDVDALEETMWRVIALVVQPLRPLLLAYAAVVARRNGAAGASVVGTRRRRRRDGLLGTQSSDGGGDGIYLRTRSRTRQANP